MPGHNVSLLASLNLPVFPLLQCQQTFSSLFCFSLFLLQASAVCLRAPVSESLSRLQRDQLQKFAQYLISELPQQVSEVGTPFSNSKLQDCILVFMLGQSQLGSLMPLSLSPSDPPHGPASSG